MYCTGKPKQSQWINTDNSLGYLASSCRNDSIGKVVDSRFIVWGIHSLEVLGIDLALYLKQVIIRQDFTLSWRIL